MVPVVNRCIDVVTLGGGLSHLANKFSVLGDSYSISEVLVKFLVISHLQMSKASKTNDLIVLRENLP